MRIDFCVAMLYNLTLMEKQMNKKFMMGLTAAVIAAVAPVTYAEDIYFTGLTSVGGGTDRAVDGLIANLTANGFTVKKQFVKSCHDGLQQMLKNPKNNFLVSVQGDMSLADTKIGGTKCPPIDSSPVKLSLFSPLKGDIIYLCTSPSYAGTTFTKIKALAVTGRKVRIGVTEPALGAPVAKMFDTQLPNVPYAILPYTSAELLLAAKSGDVDMVISTSTVQRLVDEGSTCIARSARSNEIKWSDRPIPFYGELEPGKPVAGFAESITLSILTADASQVSKTANAAMLKAFKSVEFRTVLDSIPTGHHGLGDNIPNSVTMKRIADYEREYMIKSK